MLQPKLPTRSAAFWFTDIRKTALIACIAAVLGLLLPTWNATQTVIEIGSTHPQWRWWIIPAMVLAYLFTAITPVFYFALYRNEGTLRCPKRLRLLALGAALALGIVVAAGLPKWIGSLGDYWTTMKTLDWRMGVTTVLTAARDPRTISILFGEFADLGCILLLIAFFHQANDESYTEVPLSRLLSLVTKMAVIAGGLWLAFSLVRLVVTPYNYSQLRSYALQIGRTPPQLWDMMADAILGLLTGVGLFTAPYIVYRSRLRNARMNSGTAS